ncbi:MAG: lytic transglycosylase [Bacteroidetes bacterium]|nr:MAG: lytic transglycosylase [Bacteroidota bacterium]
MNKMVLLGFGFFSFTLFAAFRADNGNLDFPTLLKMDTAITATSAVVPANSASISSQNENIQLSAYNNGADLLANAGTSTVARFSAFQLHPMAVSYVNDYKEENEERLQKMKTKQIAQFNLIDNILERYSLPKELKYLAVIESDLSSNAVSRVGAVGPWQLMSETGRLLGLKINKYNDERKNLYKSTHAAAKYLRDLYSEFNDWLLVIAAYNGGSAKVESAIRKSHSRNFWKLQRYLPTESRNHVKKYIATHYIMEGQGGITTTVTADIGKQKANALTEDELANTRIQQVMGKYNSKVVAKALGMDWNQFNRLNPEFDRNVDVTGYAMRLPIDKTDLFNSDKYDILNDSVQELLSDTASNDEVVKYPEEIKLPSAPATKETLITNKKKKVVKK